MCQLHLIQFSAEDIWITSSDSFYPSLQLFYFKKTTTNKKRPEVYPFVVWSTWTFEDNKVKYIHGFIFEQLHLHECFKYVSDTICF